MKSHEISRENTGVIARVWRQL